MNKSMLLGVVAGVGVATAGGVAGYQFFGQPHTEETGSAVASSEPVATPSSTPSAVSARAQAAAPQPAAAASAPVQEDCWDEEVQVQADPKDRNQIAGTAVGAVIGGAIGKEVGDSDLSTAAGAAAGAFIGRKVQQRVQGNRADTRTTTVVERRCAPAGSR
jgi:uncharacterized protein YcfJ